MTLAAIICVLCTDISCRGRTCLCPGALVHGTCLLNAILESKESCVLKRAVAAWVTELSVVSDGTGYALLKVSYVLADLVRHARKPSLNQYNPVIHASPCTCVDLHGSCAACRTLLVCVAVRPPLTGSS